MKQEKQKNKRGKTFPGVQTFPYIRRVLQCHVVMLEMATVCAVASANANLQGLDLARSEEKPFFLRLLHTGGGGGWEVGADVI